MSFKTILVGLDGSAQSHNALERAIALAKASKGRLVLCGVVPFPDDVLDRVLLWRTRAGFSRTLDAAVGFAKRHRVKATPVLLDGRPSTELLWLAKRSKADLIVVGSWGKSLKARTARALVGSVANELVDSAHCSVLVIR